MSTARSDHLNIYKKTPLLNVRNIIIYISIHLRNKISTSRVFLQSTIAFCAHQYIDEPLGVYDSNGNTNGPNIATSVHLRFFNASMNSAAINKSKRNWWVVSNSIVVVKTVPSTYFGVIQIPGVYAGVQQLKDVECGKTFEGKYMMILRQQNIETYSFLISILNK